MATTPTPASRHALGLPAGSVRAILGLAVLGLAWVMALKFRERLPVSFIYLQSVLLLILAHYFAAHGKTMGSEVSRSPALGLPRGTIRLLLLVGYLGLAVWLYQKNTKFDVPETNDFFFLIALLLTGFLIGYVVTAIFRVLGGGHLPYWFQDLQAWVALLAMMGLAVLVAVYVIINPSLAAEQKVNVDQVEAFLAAVVGFYFGARS